MNRTVRKPSVGSVATLLHRIKGIIALDDATYEAVKRDPGATPQALLIVALVTVAGAVNLPDHPLFWQIASPVFGMVGFVLASWLLFNVGTRLLRARPVDGDWVQMLRLSGYAECTFVLTLLRPVDIVGPVIYWSITVWGLVLSVKAIKHVLMIGTGRAIATFTLVTIPQIALFIAIYLTLKHWGLA